MRKSALLIGNGLNRATGKAAWSDLLGELRKEYGVSDVSCHHFPQEFERIFFEAAKQCPELSPYELKKKIARNTPEIIDSGLIKEFTQLPVSHIMTTNYDYNLEYSLDKNFIRKKNDSHTRERRFSLQRYLQVNSKKIWHIHGEKHCPDSICLGYEQYCSYMSKMHNHLTTPNNTYNSKTPFIRHYLLNLKEEISWPLLFFTHDIYIVGLSLSFLEINLWWLLNYRKKLQIRYSKLGIANSIHYFYNEKSENEIQDVLQMFGAMDIKLHPMKLRGDNWQNMYRNILKNIDRDIRR